jgi:Putative DNA-binding domain
MEQKQIDELLASEESETLERKQSLDKDGICKSIVAFANDMHGHELGWLICGQAPDKSLVGLRESGDEIQKTITDFARNNCSPAVPVSVQIFEKDAKRLALVAVPASPARPHFIGKAYVRMGSTCRVATDAEIILMRAAEENPKIGMLKRWLDQGHKKVVFWQLPGEGRDFTHAPRVEMVQLVEVNENWVVLDFAGALRAFPYSEFNVGWDPKENIPQIRYHGGH